jgi:tetratricopeptide (TPR) repeat protein
MYRIVFLLFIFSLLSCNTKQKNASSNNYTLKIDTIQGKYLSGKSIIRRQIDPQKDSTKIANYLHYSEAVKANQKNAVSLIWKGRWMAYLGDYKKAVAIFSKGIVQFPKDARFYRHRGHRLLSLRKFDAAIADFKKGIDLRAGKNDEIEPDGYPNKYNIPVSTLHGNLWYHLGLAYYLKNDFKAAMEAFEHANQIASNTDTKIAVANWLYKIYSHQGLKEKAKEIIAPYTASTKIYENTDYHQILLYYKGELSETQLLANKPNEARRYAVAYEKLHKGEVETAKKALQKILENGSSAAFAYIAAEATLKYLE